MLSSLISLISGPITTVLERVIPDKNKAAAMAHEIATMVDRQAHEQIMAQVQVNKQEAAHKSLFVAGWRPFIGWVCGAAMAFNFMAIPLINYGMALYGSEILPPPPLDLEVMMPVLLGMLGLGGMRSFEKRTGVAREK